MTNKLEQKSGNQSKNIQVGGNVTIGVTASEARQIAIDVFKANFYEFSEEAAKKALERAEELTDNFIEQFYKRIPHFERKLQEPSVQSSMFTAQKEYAKTGDKVLKEYLLELLIERIKSNERSLRQIVLDEALIVIPKLTTEQIDFLTLIFSSLYYNHQNIINIPSLIDLVNNKIVRFFPSKGISYSFFTHLQYSGCCTILPSGGTYKPLEEILKNRFKALFIKGFTNEDLQKQFGDELGLLKPLIMRCLHNPIAMQFNPLNDNIFENKIIHYKLGSIGKKAINFQNNYLMNNQEIVEYFAKLNPLTRTLFNDWKNKDKDLNSMRPTSVGLTIGLLNYNIKLKSNIDFESFI